MKEWLCSSCRYSDSKIEEVYVPLYAMSMDTKKVKRLVTWCNFTFCVKRKLILHCENYKPKAGKINGKLYQKQIFENQNNIDGYFQSEKH